MNKFDYIPRIIENKDWITILFLLTLVLVVVVKNFFEKQFSDFSNLLFNDKYLKIYKDKSTLLSWFTIILFLVQLLSYSFFIQLVLGHFEYISNTNGITFIQIITFLTFFILSKYLIEKIFATTLNIENQLEQFNLIKVSYRIYIGLLLIPVNLVLYYSNFLNSYVLLSIISLILIINVITYIFSLKNYQKLILGNFFYFILYICTLEIAPYFFTYYLFKK